MTKQKNENQLNANDMSGLDKIAVVNHDCSLRNERFGDTTFKSSSASSSFANKNEQICFANFPGQSNFGDVNNRQLGKNLIPNTSNSISNHSTIVINSLSPVSSPSLSNTPLRGSFDNASFNDCKILPSSDISDGHSALNPIKLILNSQIAASSHQLEHSKLI